MNNKEKDIITFRIEEANDLAISIEVDEVNQVSFYRPETGAYFGGLEIETLEKIIKNIQTIKNKKGD